MNSGTEALKIAQLSPYPISSGGDGLMFACSLFAVLSISFLLTMRAIATTRQLWIDRKRIDDVLWFRCTILIICIGGLLGWVPDAIYKISFGEVSTQTLHQMLAVREWANSVAFPAVTAWIGIYTYFEPAWTLKLSNSINKTWGGNRSQVHRFIFVVILSGLLAGAIAISKAFS